MWLQFVAGLADAVRHGVMLAKQAKEKN